MAVWLLFSPLLWTKQQKVQVGLKGQRYWHCLGRVNGYLIGVGRRIGFAICSTSTASSDPRDLSREGGITPTRVSVQVQAKG